jgi:phosphonate transport system substrate-binding protein
VLRLGAKPFLCGSTGLSEDFVRFSGALSKQVGMPVAVINSDDIEEIMDLFVKGELDVAILSSLAYVKVSETFKDLKLLGTLVVNGDVEYSSYLIVDRSAGIFDLQDLQGRRLALTNRTSGSGFLYPLTYLVNHGFSLDEIKEHAVLMGSHAEAMSSLLAGQTDAAAGFYGAFGVLRLRKVDVSNLKVIAVAGRMPYEALVVRADLDGALIDRIQEAVLRLNTSTPEGRKAFAHQVDINGWAETSPEFYSQLRTIWRGMTPLLEEKGLQ